MTQLQPVHPGEARLRRETRPKPYAPSVRTKLREIHDTAPPYYA